MHIYKFALCIFQLERQLEAVIDNADSDTRQWTPQHLEAANVPHPSIMALTPPTGDELDSKDVDVRGPDGFTPLMLASFRGMGLDSGVDDDSSGSGISGDSEESGERSPEVIRSLLMQGAAINAQTDRTGKLAILQIKHTSQTENCQCFLYFHENIFCGAHWKHLNEKPRHFHGAPTK